MGLGRLHARALCNPSAVLSAPVSSENGKATRKQGCLLGSLSRQRCCARGAAHADVTRLCQGSCQ